MGKNAAMAMTTTFDVSPMPYQRMMSGIHAMTGICRTAVMNGWSRSYAPCHIPMTDPAQMPSAAAMAYPLSTRERLHPRSPASVPSARNSCSVRQTSGMEGRMAWEMSV